MGGSSSRPFYYCFSRAVNQNNIPIKPMLFLHFLILQAMIISKMKNAFWGKKIFKIPSGFFFFLLKQKNTADEDILSICRAQKGKK